MPFNTFNNWIFDGNPYSKIPDNLDEIDSPISHIYALKLFMYQPKILPFINQFLNSKSIYYIPKKELFLYLKKIAVDFKMNKNMIPFVKNTYQHDKIFAALAKQFPLFKKSDLVICMNILNNSPDKKQILDALGISHEVKKSKTSLQKQSKNVKRTLQEFMKNFSIVVDQNTTVVTHYGASPVVSCDPYI